MQKPRRIAGWCPHYDEPSGCCYLTERMPENSTRDQKCRSDRNCKNCGIYEAWASGSNYRGK